MATDGFGTGITGATSGAVAQIVDVEIIGISRDEINTTTHSSANGWMTKMPTGVQSVPDTTMSLLFEKSQETTFRTAAINDTPEAWTVTDADGNTWACDGFVKEISHDAVPVDDCIKQSVTFGWTGAPTFTPVA